MKFRRACRVSYCIFIRFLQFFYQKPVPVTVMPHLLRRLRGRLLRSYRRAIYQDQGLRIFLNRTGGIPAPCSCCTLGIFLRRFFYLIDSIYYSVFLLRRCHCLHVCKRTLIYFQFSLFQPVKVYREAFALQHGNDLC